MGFPTCRERLPYLWLPFEIGLEHWGPVCKMGSSEDWGFQWEPEHQWEFPTCRGGLRYL